ncbi:MAG: sel1 repeat family protein [Alphaproteobacteria bacterium]|nr:sel1 repeat family protein [Alphaproteobacteria bacterium]
MRILVQRAAMTGGALALALGTGVQAQADTLQEAQARCEQKLGKGARAEEELDFGEVSYVCNCVAPFAWNNDNSKCVGAAGETASEAPKAAEPKNTEAPSTSELTAKEQNERGYQANKKKNYKEAVYWYRKAADKGHAGAMGNLARKYYSGFGVKKDRYEAFRWFKKSAQGGVLDSIASVGWLYYRGTGTRKDYAEALKWTRKAAEGDHPYGTANLGLMYENGDGVRRDYGEALKWYLKSASVGHVRAYRLIGDIYMDGKGVAKDLGLAEEWLGKAVDKGDKAAMISLGNIMSVPNAQRTNFRRARELYEKAAGAEYPVAWNNLANMYDRGWGTPRDPAYAAKLVARALKAGNDHTINQMTKHSRNWSKSFRVELQKVMRDEGVYNGSIDGSFGAGTKRAIRKLTGTTGQ